MRLTEVVVLVVAVVPAVVEVLLALILGRLSPRLGSFEFGCLLGMLIDLVRS